MDEIHSRFQNFIRARKTPGQIEVEKCMKQSKAKNDHIWKLKRDNIKKKVSWIICSAKQ
jgi:hypothetical protein